MKKVILVTVLFAITPFAISYNLSFDKYGTIGNPAEPIFIQVCTVDANLRPCALEYMKSNRNVQIFILPLSAEQIGAVQCDIKIIRDGETLHAAISTVPPKREHCKRFLGMAQESFAIVIKD